MLWLGVKYTPKIGREQYPHSANPRILAVRSRDSQYQRASIKSVIKSRNFVALRATTTYGVPILGTGWAVLFQIRTDIRITKALMSEPLLRISDG
ncbi:hypothetical protein BDV18DRAFT_135715 [Aspergillus unguis]